MRRVTLRGMLARKLRSTLTTLAIVLGVAMISGTFALTDQIGTAFENIFVETRATTDIVVTKAAAFATDDNADIVPFDQSVLIDVIAVDGVAVAQPLIQGFGGLVIERDGESKFLGPTGGAPPLVFNSTGAPFDTGTYIEGRQVEAPGEVAILKSVADRGDLRVGDTALMATDQRAQPVTIVGIFTSAVDFGGATVVLADINDVQRWFRSRGLVHEIDVAADEGVSVEELRRRLTAALPADLTVETGRERAVAEARRISDSINGFLRPALLAFAGVAIFVSAFIIFNAFSMTIGHRVRELAMLRTLGATRRQILASVLGEAIVVSLVATVVGIVAGLGFASLLLVAFDALGFGLPGADLAIAPRTVAICLLVGVGVTLAAALAPGLRATRVPPIAAVREGTAPPPARGGRFVPWLAPVMVLLGLGVASIGFFTDGTPRQALAAMGAGVLLTMVGVAMGSRWLVPPLARLIGRSLRAAGLPGRIATENTVRNPGRTAVTAAALMISVALITWAAIFTTGFKEQLRSTLSTSLLSDMLVQSKSFDVMPPDVIGTVAGVEGVSAVVAVETLAVRIDGRDDTLAATGPELTKSYRMDWVNGDDSLVTQLGADGALVEREWAKGRSLTVGSTFAVATESGRSATFTVRGVYSAPTIFKTFIVSRDAYDSLGEKPEIGIAFVRFGEGVDRKATDQAVVDALETAFPQVRAESNRAALQRFERQLDQFLALLYALLAFSVVISLLGLVNTLVLSIYERTREIGLLRAVGATRRQLRWIVRYESVITAVIGAVIGVAVGMVFGFLATRAVDGLGFVLPVAQIVIYLLAAVVCGVLAAILPARRAARLDVLQALQYE